MTSNINLSKSSFNENINLGSVIAKISSVSNNPDNTQTYSLVVGDGDTDNSLFLVSDDNLILNTYPDYENKSSYKVRLKSTDSDGETFTKSFELTVNDLEDNDQLTTKEIRTGLTYYKYKETILSNNREVTFFVDRLGTLNQYKDSATDSYKTIVSTPTPDNIYTHILNTFNLLESKINLTFKEVTNPDEAIIKFMHRSDDEEDSYGFCSTTYTGNYSKVNIDIVCETSWINDIYHQHTIVHELGHALNLEHPFEDDDGDVFGEEDDDNPITQMAYGETPGYTFFTPLDIQTLREIWGINSNQTFSKQSLITNNKIPLGLVHNKRTGHEYKNNYAFAVINTDGAVFSWGASNYGGELDSETYFKTRTDVAQIFSSQGAFAALKSDGSVITWGSSNYGGDSSSVASQLTSGVTNIFSTDTAFAALKSDGSVITWGSSSYGGDSSSVASQLTSNVSNVSSNGSAFAALKSDGSLVTWGYSSYGGDSSSVASQLTSNVSNVFSNDTAFAALKSDGSVITWGSSNYGGDSSSVASQLTSGVTNIFSTNSAFAALKSDGSLVTWGHSLHGGDSSSVASQLTSDVSNVSSNSSAFAALKSDGSVVTWGSNAKWSSTYKYGGDSSSVASQLTSGVTNIFSTNSAFAALKSDGSVVTWGMTGGDSSSVASQLTSDVSNVFSNDTAFAALKSDGSVVTWGNSSTGGDSSSVASQLTSGVTNIFSTNSAFAALKSDGSVVTWGSSYGGDSSLVASQLTSDAISFSNPSTDDWLSGITINGTTNNDSLQGSGGNDNIDGITGSDTYILSGKFKDYSFVRDVNSLQTDDQRAGINNGKDTLKNIEYIQFTDQTVEESKVDIVKTYSGEFSDYKFYNKGNGVYQMKTDSGYDDITGYPLLTFTGESNTSSFKEVSAIADIKGTFDQVTGLDTDSGRMFRLYNASFKRLPDSDGLKYWIEQFSSGANTIRVVASSFLGSSEFAERYGSNVTDEKFVNTLYQNVLGRAPDTSGLNYWLGQLSSGAETRYEALLGFAESAENKGLFTEMTGLG